MAQLEAEDGPVPADGFLDVTDADTDVVELVGGDGSHAMAASNGVAQRDDGAAAQQGAPGDQSIAFRPSVEARRAGRAPRENATKESTTSST